MLALFFQLSFVLQSKFGLDHGVGHPSYLWARPKPLSTGGVRGLWRHAERPHVADAVIEAVNSMPPV
jgi:hypothetical protein